MLHLDEKQLRSLHTRVQLRRFLDYAAAGQAEKLTKPCAKGLDPNFHCQETGGKRALTSSGHSFLHFNISLFSFSFGFYPFALRTRCAPDCAP